MAQSFDSITPVSDSYFTDMGKMLMTTSGPLTTKPSVSNIFWQPFSVYLLEKMNRYGG
jgi:hypothetical protein